MKTDYEGVPGRFQSFVIEIADIMLPVVMQENGRTALQEVYILTYTFYEMIIFMQYIKGLADRKNVTARNTKELLRDDELRKILMRGTTATKEDCSRPYLRDVTVQLRKQVEISGKDDIIFRMDRQNSLSRTAFPGRTTEYIWIC